MTNNNIIVFGANGFLGSELVKHYKRQEISVIEVTRVSQNNRTYTIKTLEDLLTKFRVEDIKYSIIFAAGNPSIRFKKDLESSYLENVMNLLIKSEFKGKFVYISSNIVSPQGVGINSVDFRKTKYASRKIRCEKLLENSGINYVIYRSVAVIGQNMSSKSHIKFLQDHVMLMRLLRLGIGRGNLALIAISDFINDINEILSNQKTNYILQPCSPLYSWKTIASTLLGNQELIWPNESEKKLNRFFIKLLPLELSIFINSYYKNSNECTTQVIAFMHANVNEELHKMLKSPINTLNKKVIITGISSGLGKILCEKLSERGFSIIGLDKDVPRYVNTCLEFFHVDLSDRFEFEDFKSKMKDENIVGVISCAGVARRGPYLSRRQYSNEIIETNFRSVLGLFDLLEENTNCNEKFFVYVSSSVAIQPLPSFSLYSSSKAATLSFFESLSMEIDPNSIKILGVIPSGMKTNFQSRNNVPISKMDKFLLLNPDKVASKILKNIFSKRKPQHIQLYLGFSTYFFILIKFLPKSMRLKLVRLLAGAMR